MSPTISLAPGDGLRRRQVYSNRPLAVYGYIVPQTEGGYAVQIGDGFTPVSAPVSEQRYATLVAATRAIVEAYS